MWHFDNVNCTNILIFILMLTALLYSDAKRFSHFYFTGFFLKKYF